MKSTKLLVLAAAGLLAAGALSACGNNGKDPWGQKSVDPTKPENLAQGLYTFVNESNAERTRILGILEKYAVDEKLTGLSIFGNGGYVVYSPDVQKGSNNYIRGYGFGIVTEGQIKADLAGESNAAWKRYYHTFESDDPSNLNYMNDQGSVVGDLIGYTNAAYWQTKMNKTKDGYDWVSDLATVNRPIAVNASKDTGLATKYKFPVKVGADLKYTTLTTNAKYSKYNNQEVKLEDYVTPYKIYYTKAYGMARGSENLTGSGSIKGSSSYYNASGAGFNEAKWNNIGIKSYVEGGKSYLEFEFNLPCTPFFAMYYLSSSMFAPVPEQFIKDLGNGDFAAGVQNWGVNSSDLSETILDHWLATGPYTLERWDPEQQIVMKKNPNYADLGRYKIEGVHFNILKAINSDPEAAIKEFEANKLHGCGVPYTQLEKYRSDARTTTTISNSNYKININTCDQATWNDLFGEEGSIDQTPEADYWECEPALSNKDFVSGLSFAIDRKTLASKIGRTPAFEYFSPNYLSDPEKGVYYNDTKEHKAAVADLQKGTDGYGYSLEKAKAAFKAAADQLIEDGVYKKGDTIKLEIAWQTPADEEEYHNDIAKNFKDAFNTSDNPLKLEVEFWAGKTWSDVYYDKMMTGQFDLGFGSVSGNSYNPLNFLEVLKSDNSSGFTLNWGIDTNEINVNNSISYNGKAWSFDALWTAADQGAYVKDGKNASIDVGWKNASAKLNDDNTLTFEADFLEVAIADDKGNNEAGVSFVSQIDFWARYDVVLNDAGTAVKSYKTMTVSIVKDDFTAGAATVVDGLRLRHISVTFPSDDVLAVLTGENFALACRQGWVMFDIYYSRDIYGIEGGTYSPGSVYILGFGEDYSAVLFNDDVLTPEAE